MQRAHVGLALTFGVGLLGCDTPVLQEPDGGDVVDSGPDAVDGSVPGDGRGIVARLAADPELPAIFDAGDFQIEIERVRIDLTDLRFIGDSAPGDERTSIASLEIVWRDDDDDGGELELSFEDAPPGIYSKLRGSVVSLEIQGQAGSAESSYEFEVERESGAPLTFDVGLDGAVLEAGGTLELHLGFDATYPIGLVPWADLEADSGEGEVEIDGGEVMEQIEARIAGAFHGVDVD